MLQLHQMEEVPQEIPPGNQNQNTLWKEKKKKKKKRAKKSISLG